MGGLVARSACHYGAQQQHGWTDAISHVVRLGSPHPGADLEKWREHRVVGVGTAARDPSNRNIFERSQRRHQGSALRRLPRRGLVRRRPRPVPPRPLPGGAVLASCPIPLRGGNRRPAAARDDRW
ncbi:hypothetical protein [Candidatus Mycobacterium methanotrophicum]|uniref:Uncharacterized protein n=1 Tax=Candidatus Mycobacterium methanotrophicum TaxID=2943498 RepID=A0ABY4QT13_9MYCO|nr:hypothetical protein [Candidatus Mycobacterium methanotrophicum]UQX13161.1 hypothetical protein M5I08_16170 [Candidatus Mycobacterium methanotrophicum]